MVVVVLVQLQDLQEDCKKSHGSCGAAGLGFGIGFGLDALNSPLKL